MSEMIHVTDENFESEIMNSDVPVLVDSAPPGAALQAAQAHRRGAGGRIQRQAEGGHVDVDSARTHAAKFGVMSVPTVLYMKGGEVKDQQIGLASKDKMIEKIQAML